MAELRIVQGSGRISMGEAATSMDRQVMLFYEHWSSIRGEFTSEQIRSVERAFQTHINGLSAEQIGKWPAAIDAATKAVLQYSGSEFNIMPENKAIFNATMLKELGTVTPRDDFRSFWKDVVSILGPIMPAKDIETVIEDGLRSAKLLVFALSESPVTWVTHRMATQ